MWRAIIFVIFWPTFAFANVEFHFFDVGEGAATLILSKTDQVLIDSGNPVSAPELIKKIKAKTNKLSALIYTHPDQDHIGGVFQILHDFKIGKKFDNGQNLPDQQPFIWYAENFRKNNYQRLSAKEELKFDGFTIKVLSPKNQILKDNWNANSLVLKIVVEDTCILLMADALKETENYLISAGEDLVCAVVQAGHHGSKYASSKKFVKATQAKTVIVSVDAGNRNGYPASHVIKSWQNSGAKVFRTDQVGTIKKSFAAH